MSSVAAQNGDVVGPHYASSKAEIIGLTHSYASLLAKEGITVNSIAPAFIKTEMLEDLPLQPWNGYPSDGTGPWMRWWRSW